MKIYHGRWDDSPKRFIGEGNDNEEVMKIIYAYIPEKYRMGYIKWIDDYDKNKQLIVDYGSWSDFIFIRGLNGQNKFF